MLAFEDSDKVALADGRKLSESESESDGGLCLFVGAQSSGRLGGSSSSAQRLVSHIQRCAPRLRKCDARRLAAAPYVVDVDG